MAYAAQKLIEDMVCYYADRLYKETGLIVSPMGLSV
jgi:hypothetical protein